MKVLTVVGNRPQFIKAAPVSAAFKKARVKETLLHTGQHYDPGMSDDFFTELGLKKPRYQLQVRGPEWAKMLRGIQIAIEREQPDWVLVYGDTNSTLAGAHAALGRAPIVHVEAGLRSGDMGMPEERNRLWVDHVADLLLCPDEASAEVVEREKGEAVVVGDVMADAVRMFAPPLEENRSGTLVTIHREANVRNGRLPQIAAAINKIPGEVLFPMHPRTAHNLRGFKWKKQVKVLDPIGYKLMLRLLMTSKCVVTDSGGLQKEAYWLGTPCVTVRPSTEWKATVDVGANVLVEPEGIGAAVKAARFPDDAPTLYGDGHAAEKIVEALLGKRNTL